MANSDVFEPHPIVRLLEKPAADFTCSDLVRAVEQLELRQVNLRYVGGDGRLKTVAFPINSREHLIEVLMRGERVDGSSIFPGTETNASDVYIVPRHHTAFLNPFGERLSLDLLCAFYGEDGKPLPYAREQVVRRAAEVLLRETGMVLEAFGELEYYLVDEAERIYPVEEERGYQESAPFSKGQHVREQVLGHLSAMGIKLKYAHGEVGNILEDGRQLVQHEIEFWPAPVEHAADALVMAKWVVREVAHGHGLEVTFAPSVSGDGAGNGLHVHSRLVRDGASAIMGKEGLNATGRRLVAGYLSAAKALTAFGNTVPTSYLRFADGDESPAGICWARPTAPDWCECPSPGVVTCCRAWSPMPTPTAPSRSPSRPSTPRRSSFGSLTVRPTSTCSWPAWPSRPGADWTTPGVWSWPRASTPPTTTTSNHYRARAPTQPTPSRGNGRRSRLTAFSPAS